MRAGLESREAALRLVTGSTGSEGWAADLEVKCVDLHANPYLLLAGLLAAAFGPDLVGSVVAVRETELEQPGESSPAEVADASRWTH